MPYDEVYYRMLAKERGAKLNRIRDLIHLGRSLQADDSLILRKIMDIIQDDSDHTQKVAHGLK